MTAQITTLAIKDGAGTDRTVQAIDLSGTGTGPWSFLHGLVDAAGAAVTAANPLAVNIGGDVAKAAVPFGPSASTTYAAGQILLAPTEIANAGRIAGGTGLVTSVGLALAAAVSVQVDAVFFSSQPSGTYVAGAALSTPAAADLARISKVMHVTDWTALNAAAWGQAPAEPRFYKCDDATRTQSLWVMLVARGSITLAAATDGVLSVRMARN